MTEPLEMRFRITPQGAIPVDPAIPPRHIGRKTFKIVEASKICGWPVAALVATVLRRKGATMSEKTEPRIDTYADVVPVYEWAAKLRAVGMSTPVAQYLACVIALSDVAVSLDMVERGTSAAWSDAKDLVGHRDGQDAYDQTTDAINRADELLRDRLWAHLEAEGRRAIRGKDGAR